MSEKVLTVKVLIKILKEFEPTLEVRVQRGEIHGGPLLLSVKDGRYLVIS